MEAEKKSISVSFCLMRQHSDSDVFYFTNSLMYKQYKTKFKIGQGESL